MNDKLNQAEQPKQSQALNLSSGTAIGGQPVSARQGSLRVLQERYSNGQELAAAEIKRVEEEGGDGAYLDSLRRQRARALMVSQTRATMQEVQEAMASGRTLSLEECARYQLRLTLAMVASIVA